MTRKILAMSLVLASNMGVAREGLPPNWGTLIEKWETPVLVLLSLALQVILALLANQRKRTNNVVITIIIWSAYMAADYVATFTLGVISTNLQFALKNNGSLDASMELATFWAPFLLVHLGGQDTITAYALEDTELWLRHFSSLIVETVSALYIFFRVMKRSRLSTLSAMMLVAGVIKYGERTLCLWFASYNRRKAQALEYFDLGKYEDQLVQLRVDNLEELLAIKMFQQTERMFADVQNSSLERIVRTTSSSKVSKLITMELELMYENLYTKAKINHSCWGLALRLISFLLILGTLISFPFSCLHHRHNYSTFELSVTFLLLGVAILLEVYAVFVFLTSCRTVSWLTEHRMNTASQAMRCLSSLRTPSWSNSMGQVNMVKSIVRPEPMDPFSKVITFFHRKVLAIMRKPKWQLFVYERPVKDYVKEGIHKYIKRAADAYNVRDFSIVNSRGRVPLTTWKEQSGNDHHGGAEVDPTNWLELNFDMELEVMVSIWYSVTEICYYRHYNFLDGEKGNANPSQVYLDWKVSKYLSRYMMQLYVVSSDILPLRGPLTEKKISDDHRVRHRKRFNLDRDTSNPEEERNGRAANHQRRTKQQRKRDTVERYRKYHKWALKNITTGTEKSILRALLRGDELDGYDDDIILKALSDGDEEDPGAHASKQREQLWKLLSEIWIELLVSVANQCRGNQHAQHLRQGGEFLTHVWVYLGHSGLFEHW